MNGGLRIVFVAPFGLRHKSTVWARALPLAHELNQLGHHASILIPPWDCPQDSGTALTQDGVRIEHISLDGGLMATSVRLLQRIQAESPDIVHIIKPRAYAGIVQWLLWQKRRTGFATPAIILDVDDWERPWAAINHYPRYQAAFLQWQEEWGIRHADAITAASLWLYNKVSMATPGTPTLHLPNGVYAQGAPYTRNYALHSPPRILYLSRFVEVTPAWLGEFWGCVQREIDDVVLYVAGKALHTGGESPYLLALSQLHNSQLSAKQNPANVTWLGYINPDELPGLYSSVDCAIFPSENTALHQAKCSVRLANMLSYGVPAIASRVGEQAAYGANDAAVLLPANATPSEFAHAVIQVLRSRDHRENLSKTAMQRMESRYAWSIFGKRLSDFYSQV